jgi:DeoR family transcriptional regulator, suf operon transcriptional repressor
MFIVNDGCMNNASISDNVQLRGETRQRILALLLDGEKSAGQIAKVLCIQKSASRAHLESLLAEGYVRSRFNIEKLGRPKKVYGLTDHGREFFPRRYDLVLNLLLKKIAEKEGSQEARKLVESVADSVAADVATKIQKSGNSNNFEESLKLLNSASNELGFVSSISKVSDRKNNDNTFMLKSNNCIVHKVAVENQENICHGLHDRMILESLGGKANVDVKLKECMALGDACCTHIITTKSKDRI